MKKIRIGLLPLYLKLYDETLPHLRERLSVFYEETAKALETLGLEVERSGLCRVRDEFFAAVCRFQTKDADAIVTLHLAYSPSLESADVLAETPLPLIVLDATPDFVFDGGTDPGAILYNHGIHGVQDLCNVLKRKGKDYVIHAGHCTKSDVLARVAGSARAAAAAAAMKSARVGIVGEPFPGMGDFALPFEHMKKTIGIETVPYDFKQGRRMMDAVTDGELAEEYQKDCALFNADKGVESAYMKSERTGLALRRWAEKEKLTAFTVNFLATEKNPDFPYMPFLEACKAMERGIGYAGEGDVLTAALVGALLRAYPETSFAEMFCPSWRDGTVFLSHMGEYNLRISDGRPRLIEKDFPFTSAENPAAALAMMNKGRAVFVNLAPTQEGYTLITAPGEMVTPEGEDRLAETVHGWLKPDCPLASFLERYSMEGGTHHAALVYGADPGEMAVFAQFMGWKHVRIG
jgi:L-arabinose isomerase